MTTSVEVDDKAADKSIALLTAYYGTVRQEILQRSATRESTNTLFLGASAAIASVAIGAGDQAAWLLFAIPILGLGASSIYLQHTLALRGFWRYLATEYQEEVSRVLGGTAPKHWDISEARHQLGASAGMRAVAAVLLLIVPQVLAAIAGVSLVPRSPSSLAAGASSGLAILLTLAFVIYALTRRASGQRLPTL